jgi:hypothetical protein
LADRLIDSIEISNDMLGERPSEGKKQKIEQQFNELGKEFNAKISELLGEENLKKYQEYERTLGERQFVMMFVQEQSPDDKLTEAQQQALIDSMSQERENVSREGGYDKEIIFPSEASKLKKMTEDTFNVYMKSADAVLPSALADQFKTYLKRQLDMIESFNEMRSQISDPQQTLASDGK